MYADLVGDGLGERVRLEQERIDWEWVQAQGIWGKQPAASDDV
ncbi:MAG: Wadjet anti-phage system protein JetD domain-containing protein [Mycobacterium sp.]